MDNFERAIEEQDALEKAQALLATLERSKPGNQLVAQQSGEVSPTSLPEMAQRLASAVQSM